ncbi:FAD-dependent oxidoreductase [Rhodococcus sp. NPDC058532]|uniref:FAD-dependent oxidoreductase n=1 Tax=Rhodococcus sp. NPDC058532 TaxID=3346540 RepID=UPI0036600CFB
MNDAMIGDRAVVLGGSMAGLLAARVLADAYAQVVVVERDELPDTAGQRRGVPQGHHIHSLMARGQQVFEELFPGFAADLVAGGAPMLDQLAEARLYFGGHRFAQAASGIAVISVSRPCIEGYVRERVRALPGVVLDDHRDVLGLAASRDGGRVTGARVSRRVDGSGDVTLDADLVVDATGRGSRLPRWLEALGYPRPAEDRVTTDITYATGVVRLRAGALGAQRAVIVPPGGGCTRGGALAAIEGGRHILTLVGMLGEVPPTDANAFVEYTRSLPIPDIHDAVRDAELLDPPVAMRFPASIRHRYERLPRFPAGLLAVGDVLCSFNPVYGQGMSVAALEARTLREHLASEPDPRKVLRGMAKIVDPPWDIAAGADLAFPAVPGPRPLRVRMANTYVPLVQAAAARDPEVGAAFLRVAGMLDDPTALMRPALVRRVAAAGLRRITSRRGSPGSPRRPPSSRSAGPSRPAGSR